MLNTDTKYIRFQCGPYGLLLNIASIVEICEYHSAWCSESGSSSKHHGKIILWNNIELPFFDMRVALSGTACALSEPKHALVLKTATQNTPCAIVTIDEVHLIEEISESQGYCSKGINPQLEILFDRFYTDKSSSQIFMRLAPVELWANKKALDISLNNIGVTDAY